MSRPTKEELIDAALNYRRLLIAASNEVIDEAQTYLNGRACNSMYADSHEPMSAIGNACFRELLQRSLNNSNKCSDCGSVADENGQCLIPCGG